MNRKGGNNAKWAYFHSSLCVRDLAEWPLMVATLRQSQGNKVTWREKDVDCNSPAVFSQHLRVTLALRRDLKAGGLIQLEGI